MLIDQILERNRAFVKGRVSEPLPPPEAMRVAVMTCYDPRLDEMIRPSLGFGMGDAILVRSAGAVVPPAGDPLRSLALAIFMFSVREILVVGHSSCRMASFETASFIDAFRGRGVARAAFGAEDLRTWVGAIADPKRGVMASVAAIRAAPFLPADVSVAGFVLDDTTGALEVVLRPDEAVVGGLPASATAPGPATASPSSESPPPEPRPAAASLPAPGAAPRAPASGDDLARAAGSVRAFVRTLEAKADWKGELAHLRRDLERDPNPLARIQRLDEFVRNAASDSREVREAFERLREETAQTRQLLNRGDLIDLFRRPAPEKRR